MANDKERLKLESLIKEMFSDDDLIHIFKDLVWGIIRLKEEKIDDAIKKFGESCEHSHKFLFFHLRRLSPIQVDLINFPNTKDWEVNEKLHDELFPLFEIKNLKMLKNTRQAVEKCNRVKHEYKKKRYPVFKSADVLLDCISTIKLVLITTFLLEILKANYSKDRSNLRTEIQLKKLNIDREFSSFFIQNNQEIIESILDIIFSRTIRNLLFKNSILDSNDILNSKVLQKYLPYYLFDHWRFEKILKESKPLPFRAVGPQIADFEIGDWVYIPKIAKYIFKHLNKNRKSVLISAGSGTGKTVISRWVGFKFYKMGYNVFYIDCLDHKIKNIATVLDQIIIQHKSAKRFQDTLFIFENIHILDNELKIRLSECKDVTLILMTERIFDAGSKEKDHFSQNFEKFQNIEILKDHWSYRNTVKGIIKTNAKNTPILKQIKYIGNQNLWIYAFILKLFKQSLEVKKDSSIIDLFTDFDLVGRLITEYFEDLLNTKVIKIKSSELDVYSNHLHYFLGILSIFSEYELWTNRSFIDHVISINDKTPLGTFNSKINLNKEILMEMQSFLIDFFEISNRFVFIKPGIKELELKIPHSQMAIIYKNCILGKYERSFPGLIEQVQFLYISYGKYFGSFLQQKYSLMIREGHHAKLNSTYKGFFNFDSYLRCLNYLENPQILQNQINNNSIEEIELFFYYLSFYNNSLEKELFINIFQEEELLFNHSWKSRIEESNSSYLFLLLRRIKKDLGINSFINFVEIFQIEIFDNLKQDRGDYIFSFLNFFLNLKFSLWTKLENKISDLIMQISINMDDLFSIYIRNRKLFERISETHKFYPLVKKVLKKLILNINFEEEHRFVPSPYYNYSALFSQIYQEILGELLTQPNQELHKTYEGKLRTSNLTIIINYLKDLYEQNPRLAMHFFNRFLNIIKEKLYESDIDNIITFFDLLSTSFKEEKNFIKESFLSNWKWFEGIFIRYTGLQFFLFSRFRVIEYFFKDLFPEFLPKFQEFNKIQTELRLKEYYDSLECKLDVADKLTVILEDERNHFILNLFNNAIYESLKTQTLPYYTKSFQKLNTSDYLRDKWDFKNFILSKDFKIKLEQANKSEFKDFFNIYWFEPWRSILFNGYKDLLIDRFGQDYEFILKLEDNFEERLRKFILNLELLEIIKHYNHYNDPFFGNTESYVFLKLRKILGENSTLFLDDRFETKFSSLKFPDRFNLLLLLKIYHPTVLKEIFSRKSAINLDNLEKPEGIFEVITILEFYKLNLDVLKGFNENLNREYSLFESVLKAVKQIDLGSLRYLIQINPAKLLSEYPNIKLSDHLENSNLLQLSIFLYKPELSICLKIPGHTYVRKMSFMGGPIQKFPFVLELPESELKQIKSRLDFVLWLEDRILKPKSESISYSQHSDIITEIITTQFTPFSSEIVLLIKKSNLRDIAIYFRSLTKLLNEIPQERLEIPEELENYLISKDFKIKFDEAEFYDIYYLFKCMKTINFNLAKEIWNRNRKSFTQEDFSSKFRSEYTYQIFKFYDMFNTEHYKFDTETIEILKKIMNVSPPEMTISYFLKILSYDDFRTLISVFKDEIIKIGKKYSKFELKRVLSENFLRKYNAESLNIMRTLFQDRLNELYFFE